MPYEVSQILTGLGEPITASPEEPLQTALDRMLHYQFSQLPVIKENEQSRQFYFITYEMILRALHDFGSKINDPNLTVNDALVRIPRVYRSTDNLFELLAGMREINAALIVDDETNLTHIVTTYDTTQYFRQWAEDIMHARDVEHSLKQIITNAFKKQNGEIDEEARQLAIEELISSNKDLRKKFGKAITQYLTQLANKHLTLNAEWAERAFFELLKGAEIAEGENNVPTNNLENDLKIAEAEPAIQTVQTLKTLQKGFYSALSNYLRQQGNSNIELDQPLLEAAFLIVYNPKEKVRTFNELTLDTYIRLFFNEQCWDRCSGAIGKEKDVTNNMLEGVRDTRNKLAHFREEEITTAQRLQLQRCADWLGELEKPIRVAFEASAPGITEVKNETADSIPAIDEMAERVPATDS